MFMVFHGGGLSNISERQRFTLSKIFAVIRLNRKHLSNFYCGKRIFSRGTKYNNSSSEALSFFFQEFMLTEAIFYQPKPIFLGSSEQGKWENLHTVLVDTWLVEVVFFYHSLLPWIRHLSQDKRRHYRKEIALLSATTRHDLTREHQGIQSGATRGALP